MKCRIDKKKCKVFLDFGKMPIANGFIKKKNFKKIFLLKKFFFSITSTFLFK